MKLDVRSAKGIGLTLLILVALGAALRISYNNVTRYGNGDEYHYRTQLQEIAAQGWRHYPTLVRAHLDQNPDFPAPYRWGYLAVGRLACLVRGACDERSLAWVATLSGIAVVALVAMLGIRLFQKRTAVVATALMITSPLHLNLGRRAYADELHTACLLLALWAMASLTLEPNFGHKRHSRWFLTGLSILALTMAWSIKESVFCFLPALFAWLFCLRHPPTLRPRDFLLLLLPPVLFVGGFLAFNHGFEPARVLLNATRHSFLHSYSRMYQYGPPHRPLVELFTLAPWIFGLLPIVPVAAWGMTGARVDALMSLERDEQALSRQRARALVVVFGLILAAFLFLPKNLRFYAVLDPLARLLVAWVLCEALPIGSTLTLSWWAALLLCHAGFELALFHRAFVVSAVTDPTASAIFRALQIIPKEGHEKPWHPPIIVLGCGLLSTALAWVSVVRCKVNRSSVAAAVITTAFALGLPQLFRPFRSIISAIQVPGLVRETSENSPPFSED